MKKIFYASVAIALLVVSSCNKDGIQKVLNITAIDDNTSQIVNMKLKNMKKTSFSIGCHVMSSTTFDVRTKIFGYMDCNNIYRMVNIETGEEVKQIPLPESINLVVLDSNRNVIIGHYYVNGTEIDNGTDHVLTVNLDNGNIVSNKQFYVGGFWDATTCFFRDIENEYVLIRRDWTTDGNELVFINPSTGGIIRTASLATDVGNGVYDKKNNRLIGTTYEAGKNYIVTVDLNTGNTLSKVVAQGLGSHLAAEMDYDAETNCYILVSSNNEVLFFDVKTGKIEKRYQLDFDIVSLKFWRSKE